VSSLVDRGVGRGREWGQGGHVPLRNCHAENFFSEQYGMFDIQSNFQHNFRVSMGALSQTHPGLCIQLVTEPTLLPPSEKNPG